MLYINDHLEDISAELLEKAIYSLPPWRREQAMKYRFPEGRRECALSYLEFCRGLRLEYGIDTMPTFSYNENGKPYLYSQPDIHFSLSHCKKAIGCYMSSAPCGLDIESIRSAKESLVQYCMNEEECHQIFSSPNPDVAFITLWTRKEAVFKLKGTGINNDIKDILSPKNTEGINIQTVQNLFNGYILSVAQHSDTKIQLWK
jgi:4'-phosphopantetheinyl transferase